MSLSEDDDLLAAEYVLGTLDHAARTAASTRRASDQPFAQAILHWEARLGPLNEAGSGISPPAYLWTAILARLGQVGGVAAETGQVVRFDKLGRELAWWKRATAASMALAAALALWVSIGPGWRVRPPGPTLVAVLQKTDEAPAFVMKATMGDRSMSVMPIGAPPVPGKSYELWLIDPAVGAPKSLGVLGASASSRTVLPPLDPTVLARATYAVTIEQAGGAPGGAPTSPPVFSGHLLRTDP